MTEDPNLPKLRGKEEEARLRRVLLQCHESAGGLSYVSPTAVYFPTENGVTEADAVFIHESGVYVFECKHMTGEVSGKLRDRMWTKTGDGRVLSFPNPVLQNRRHADAAAVFFGVKREECFSCVVFNDACDISRVEKGGERIWKTGEVQAELFPYLLKKRFSKEETERLMRKAEKAASSADKYAEAHAAGIRDAKQRKKAEKKKGR
ncbi:MAG: NERD domain-containing protein [Methanocorpusculum parvum]|nr:NERD domain-containing protein [Methanocorpusculum parvum]